MSTEEPTVTVHVAFVEGVHARIEELEAQVAKLTAERDTLIAAIKKRYSKPARKDSTGYGAENYSTDE